MGTGRHKVVCIFVIRKYSPEYLHLMNNYENSLLCRSKLTILLYGRRQLLHLLRVTLYMTYEADLRKML